MNDRDLDLLQNWQYELPEELIASRPAERREDARLMVIDRQTGRIVHRLIRDLPELLNEHDLLVFNNTRVLRARLFGFRTATKGRWEGLFLEEDASGYWRMLCETRGRLQPGETVTIVSPQHDSAESPIDSPVINPALQLILTLLQKLPDGTWLVDPGKGSSTMEILNRFGSLPLPPYMRRRVADADDECRYQTSFASQPGAVAAPTAGLHFSQELLRSCEERGIQRTELTLHTGIGTFRPVTAARLSEHTMHSEWCSVSESACERIREARQSRGRIVVVGTTCVRTLETMAVRHDGVIQPWQGDTNIFILPGHSFRMVDSLLTNFHLPGSTLLVLVAAFAGYDLMMEAYRQAISQRYRFFSYGDAMLIL